MSGGASAPRQIALIILAIITALLLQRLAANDQPPGSTIIVEVPTAPAVYRRLRSQAEAAGQTPAQLMGSILTAAAAREELE
jgi:hypothetical protein